MLKTHTKKLIFTTIINIVFIACTKDAYPDLSKSYQFEQHLLGKGIQLVKEEQETSDQQTRSLPSKPWTIIVYMAADNDLRSFASANIRQMASIGSNEYVNIIIQLEIRLGGNQKISRRYFVEKNQVSLISSSSSSSHRLDSGNPQTLISCCQWALSSYPAQHYALILWDHATGCIEPSGGKFFAPNDLFNFGSSRFEIDTPQAPIEWVTYEQGNRGVCWDATTGNFITNNQLDRALEEIREKYMGNKKFDIIGFDACLMSMIEIAYIAKKHADFMVASQEVELGTGWNYARALSLFSHTNPSPLELAKNIVHAYGESYKALTEDYTQSAINLFLVDLLEKNINKISELLISILNGPEQKRTKNILRASANRLLCTHFDEPSYLDLHHLYKNLLSNLKHLPTELDQTEDLRAVLTDGMNIIQKMVIANSVGKNYPEAKGVSIYLPETRIHPSYHSSSFAQNNNWMHLLKHITG